MERRKKRKISFSQLGQTQILIMKKLGYNLNSTLEHMALVKIATVLWNHDDIRNCLTYEVFRSRYSCGEDTNPRCERMIAWQKIENIVTEKALRMLLPEPLKVKVISCIKPIGMEILAWIEGHVEVAYLAMELPSEFCWTSHGKIDRKKTAVASIKDETISIAKRYKLACIYCLENDIKTLRHKMPKNPIMSDLEDSNVFENCFEYKKLVHIWDCILKGKIAKLPHENRENACTPSQYAFEWAAQCGHKSAAEYFFQKLTLLERKESLARTAKYVIDFCYCNCDDVRDYKFVIDSHGDVILFLLSQMDNQQQLEVFKKCHSFCCLLQCSLDWPWQGFILETARYVQEFLSEYDYEDILYFFIKKIINGFKDFNYQKLIREFYQLIPKTHKTYFYRNPFEGGRVRLAFPSSLLALLFEIQDKENISLILKDATAAEKDKIIFCDEGKDICVDLACKNEWNLLEYFLTECIASQEKLIEFREEITGNASRAERKTTEDILRSFYSSACTKVYVDKSI